MPPPYAVRRSLLPLILSVEIALAALLAAAGVLGLVAAPLDRRLRISRLAAMGVAYVGVELAALAALLGVWLARPLAGPTRSARADLAVTRWALGRVLGAARRTVGLRVVLEEPADPAPLDGPDPVLVLARHGGIGDSFALVWLLAARYGRRPRVVLKGVLRWEPLIDVALSRMGACFLPPVNARPQPLESMIGSLADQLGSGDALLLFPEGGNWTPRRRLTAIGRLWSDRKPDAVRAAALMEHVLPPRAGGVLACLESRPDIPAVVVAHTGLDKITTAAGLWRAVPFAVPMTIRWWPPAHPPYGEEERVGWLTAEWAVVDQWIDSRVQRDGSENFSNRHHSSPS